MTTPVLKLQGVTKEFPGIPPVRAVDNLSFDVRSGEMTAIVGASGSGKSTLLNLMGTLDRPTEGTVFIDGVDTGQLRDREVAGLRSTRIGFVFQQFHLLAGMTALDNVAVGLVYQGRSQRVRRERSAAVLDRVGLGHRRHHTPAMMSGGERQRVAIARALVGDPAIVLADEPTGNLDSKNSSEILMLLTKLNMEGSTIVMITHDHGVASRIPRRVTISDGRIVSDERSI